VDAVLGSQLIEGLFLFQKLLHRYGLPAASASSLPTPIEKWFCTIFQQPYS